MNLQQIGHLFKSKILILRKNRESLELYNSIEDVPFRYLYTDIIDIKPLGSCLDNTLGVRLRI